MIIVGIFLGKTSPPDIGKFQQAFASFTESYNFKTMFISPNISYDAERVINEYARGFGIRPSKIRFPTIRNEQDMQKFVYDFVNDISRTRLSPIVLGCGTMNDHENALINYFSQNGVMVVDLLQ